MTEPVAVDLPRLHHQGIEVARDLIRLGTTNARAPGAGQRGQVCPSAS